MTTRRQPAPVERMATDDLFFDDDNNLDIGDDTDRLETRTEITPAMLKRASQHRMLSALKGEHLRDVLTELPEPGYTYHVISNGRFDFWTFLPAVLDWIGHADEFLGSTWTLNRSNARELLAEFDAGRIRRIHFLTGIYFKRREPAVYATLVEGLLARGQRYVAMENHAKIAAFANHATATYVVIEGSANFTANPRIEQYTLCNDRAVYDFHAQWIGDVLDAASPARHG